MAEPFKTTIYYPANSQMSLLMSIMVAWCFMGGLVVKGTSYRSIDDLFIVGLGWSTLLLGLGVLSFIIASRLFRYPRLVLHPKGFEMLSLFGRWQSHSWWDISRFVLSGYGRYFVDHYAACAFLNTGRVPPPPYEPSKTYSFLQADITISHRDFSSEVPYFGRSEQSAKEFVERLNQ